MIKAYYVCFNEIIKKENKMKIKNRLLSVGFRGLVNEIRNKQEWLDKPALIKVRNNIYALDSSSGFATIDMDKKTITYLCGDNVDFRVVVDIETKDDYNCLQELIESDLLFGSDELEDSKKELFEIENEMIELEKKRDSLKRTIYHIEKSISFCVIPDFSRSLLTINRNIERAKEHLELLGEGKIVIRVTEATIYYYECEVCVLDKDYKEIYTEPFRLTSECNVTQMKKLIKEVNEKL